VAAACPRGLLLAAHCVCATLSLPPRVVRWLFVLMCRHAGHAAPPCTRCMGSSQLAVLSARTRAQALRLPCAWAPGPLQEHT
jgi:hypothetical protein